MFGIKKFPVSLGGGMKFPSKLFLFLLLLFGSAFHRVAFAQAMTATVVNSGTCTLYIAEEYTGNIAKVIPAGSTGSATVPSNGTYHVFAAPVGVTSNCYEPLYSGLTKEDAESCTSSVDGKNHRFTTFTPTWYVTPKSKCAPKTCSLPWGGSVNNGHSVTAYASSTVPYGSSCTSQTRTCSSGTLSGSYTASSCSVQPPANCSLPWGGSISHNQSVTAYSSSSVPFGSSCSSQTRTCNSGSLSGSFSASSCSVQSPANCSAQQVSWGTGGSCKATTSSTSHGGNASVTNTAAGAKGGAVAACYNGSWTTTPGSCEASFQDPTGIQATDGTIAGKITVTWPVIAGATSYDIQYKLQSEAVWQAANTTAATWSITTSNEQVHEFQVRAKNAVGVSQWSAVETGFIRPLINPIFVSQAGIPERIGVGQKFTYTQVWNNQGAETWTGSAYGTSPFNPSDSSVWGIGNTTFPGTTITGASTTVSNIATAPSNPGLYTLQRIMQKNGVPKGAPSNPIEVTVVGQPTCSAIQPSITTIYNPEQVVSITLQSASFVESGSISVWGEIGGKDDLRSYPVNISSGIVTASFPIASHMTPGETKINIEANVANPFFPAVNCSSTAVNFVQLPSPQVVLTPTAGSFTEPGLQGFVAKRQSGDYAMATVNVGPHTSMKVAMKFLSPTQQDNGASVSSITAGVATPLSLLSSVTKSLPAWGRLDGILRVSYADPDAAAQGRITDIPIAVLMSPQAMQVSASGTADTPPSVKGKIHLLNEYNALLHGTYVASLMQSDRLKTIRSAQPVGENGQWINSDLDYSTLYNVDLVSVVRAIPPVGVSLMEPIEFVSSAFKLPVQAPQQVVATDGTREDDVKISWVSPASGVSFRYRVFRDDIEITQGTGLRALEILDTPPVRGQTYNYQVKTLIGSQTSEISASDTGYVPQCRAVRVIGAGLNAEMNALNGLMEQWDCLEAVKLSGTIDSNDQVAVSLTGAKTYRQFSVPVPSSLKDGPHVLVLDTESVGVVINNKRAFSIPFNLDRSSINIRNISINYDGSPVVDGVSVQSIGRFSITMDGGSGIGFAEQESK